MLADLVEVDLSVAHDDQGEASEEQGKARSNEGNETSGNAIKATHDTSFGSEDDAADELIKIFRINGVPPLRNAEQHYQSTKQKHGANAGHGQEASRDAIDRNHGASQIERYTFAIDGLRISAEDAVEFSPTACDPFTIGEGGTLGFAPDNRAAEEVKGKNRKETG